MQGKSRSATSYQPLDPPTHETSSSRVDLETLYKELYKINYNKYYSSSWVVVKTQDDPLETSSISINRSPEMSRSPKMMGVRYDWGMRIHPDNKSNDAKEITERDIKMITEFCITLLRSRSHYLESNFDNYKQTESHRPLLEDLAKDINAFNYELAKLVRSLENSDKPEISQVNALISRIKAISGLKDRFEQLPEIEKQEEQASQEQCEKRVSVKSYSDCRYEIAFHGIYEDLDAILSNQDLPEGVLFKSGKRRFKKTEEGIQISDFPLLKPDGNMPNVNIIESRTFMSFAKHRLYDVSEYLNSEFAGKMATPEFAEKIGKMHDDIKKIFGDVKKEIECCDKEKHEYEDFMREYPNDYDKKNTPLQQHYLSVSHIKLIDKSLSYVKSVLQSVRSLVQECDNDRGEKSTTIPKSDKSVTVNYSAAKTVQDGAEKLGEAITKGAKSFSRLFGTGSGNAAGSGSSFWPRWRSDARSDDTYSPATPLLGR